MFTGLGKRSQKYRDLVVLSIDTREFSTSFPNKHWSRLERGVMIDTEAAGLIHLSDLDDDMRLVERGVRPTPREWATLRTA